MAKLEKYERIYIQLKELLKKSNDIDARMCSVVAVLHHKIDYNFWTGFYCLNDGKLIVKTYQGPVACMELKKDDGVCWAAINAKETIIVADVEQFPGHIACDSRSKSEIAVPLKNNIGEIVGVLDIDSKELNSFDKVDADCLQKIVALIYNID